MSEMGLTEYSREKALDQALDGIVEAFADWLESIGENPKGDGTAELAAIWNESDPTGSEVPEYYRRRDVSRAMGLELAAWHVSDPNVRKQFDSIIRHAEGPRVLDFGAGIGTLAIAMALARPDLSVDVIEIAPLCRQFIEHRAGQIGVEIHILDDGPIVTAPGEEYNTIVAMDVVEHLPRPAAFLEMASLNLVEDGLLACNWIFQKDESHPCHINECTNESGEFHRVLRELFGPRDESAVVHVNGWPSVHRRLPRKSDPELREDQTPDFWDKHWSDITRRDDKWPLYQAIAFEVEGYMATERKTSVRVLDLGCGAGALLDRLSAIQGVSATGFDFSVMAVEHCKAKGRRAVIGDVQNLMVHGIEDEDGADIVVCSDLFRYVADPEAVFAHARRVLVEGGLMLIGERMPKGDGFNASDAETEVIKSGLTPDCTKDVECGSAVFGLVLAWKDETEKTDV